MAASISGEAHDTRGAKNAKDSALGTGKWHSYIITISDLSHKPESKSSQSPNCQKSDDLACPMRT
jgi:hypothetical protein